MQSVFWLTKKEKKKSFINISYIVNISFNDKYSNDAIFLQYKSYVKYYTSAMNSIDEIFFFHFSV